MKILNFGSLNIDLVYQVEHIARPGETIASSAHQVFAGGKGANQSAALARAGARVFHAGQVGPDGQWLVDKLARLDVDVQHIRVGDTPTGHAIIQVDRQGQNSIVLFAGANAQIDQSAIDATLSHFGAGDILLLQNEINDIPYIMAAAAARGLTICLNPAPFGPEVRAYPLELIDLLIVNETEATGPCGRIHARCTGYPLPPLPDRADAGSRWCPVPLPNRGIPPSNTAGRSSRYDRCGRHLHRLFSPGPDRRHDGARRHDPCGAGRGPVRYPPGAMDSIPAADEVG